MWPFALIALLYGGIGSLGLWRAGLHRYEGTSA
jgi:hypothetical protein